MTVVAASALIAQICAEEDQRPIYLDYHATTPVDPRVASVVMHQMTCAYGNAHSADHRFGDAAAEAVDRSAADLANLLGASRTDVVWTSGATEAINIAIQGFVATRSYAQPVRIVVSPTEHVAVLDTCQAMMRAGRATIHVIGVDTAGRVNLDEIDSLCRNRADLLCVMAANNEVGTIAPVDQIAAISNRYGVAYLCDATQAAGRIELNVERDRITFLVVSAHKMYGPKGVGALVTRFPRLLAPVFHGGEQQRGLRPGTLNVPGIVGMGEASRLRRLEMTQDEAEVAARRDRFQAQLLARVDDLVVNGDRTARLAGNLHISIPDVPNGAIIARVRQRLAIATGAACSSGIEAPSHVLRAMNLQRGVVEGALRIGIGKFSTDSDVDEAVDLLAAAVRSVRATLHACDTGKIAQ